MKCVQIAVVSIAILALAGPGPLPAATATEELERGIRQLAEGDFEGAVLTLDAAARGLAGDPARARDLGRAYLHLGIAYVALEQRERARVSFREALRHDKDLRLLPDRYSPKVIAVFEEARQEARASETRGKSSKLPFVILGAGGATAAVIALASGGASPTSPPSGQVSFANARFATPVLDCPDGSLNRELSLAIDFDATNPMADAVTLVTVSSTLIIQVSPLVPSEVGFASSRETVAVPATVPAHGAAVVRATTSLICANGTGDSPRFNEWSGRLTLSTSAGVFTLEAADRLRVNIP